MVGCSTRMHAERAVTRRALSVAVALGLLGGCTRLPEVPAACCGNGVLDPGEECDSPEPSCGAPPDGGACETAVALGGAACRRVCVPDGGVACPGSSICGQDRICRRATGTFTAAAPLGSPGALFQLLDVDGDGALDLASQDGVRLEVFRNDHAGGFSPWASGSSRAAPADTPLRVGVSGRPLIAAATPEGVNLFVVGQDQALHSAVVAPSLVDESKGPLRFLGVAHETLGEPHPSGFFFRPAAHTIVQALGEPGAAALGEYTLDECNHAIANPPEMTSARGGKAQGFVDLFLLDRKVPCITHEFAASRTPLDTSALVPPPVALRRPLLADFDGDGILDAGAAADGADGKTSVVLWRGARDGSFGAPRAIPVVSFPPFDLQDAVAADFNGDGAAELVVYPCVLGLLRPPGSVVPDGGVGDPFDGVSFKELDCAATIFDPNETGAHHVAVADFNRDGATDVAYAHGDNRAVTLCFHRPGAGFTCTTVLTRFPGVDALLPADINGDGLRDLVAASYAPPDPGHRPSGGIAVILAHAFAFPDGTVVDLELLSGQVEGVVPVPNANLSDDLFVALRGVEAHGAPLGIGVGRSHVDGQPLFSFEGIPLDSRLRDDDGDGALDLVELGLESTQDVQVYRGDGQGGFRPGTVMRRYLPEKWLPPDAEIDYALFVDTGDSAPAIALLVEPVDKMVPLVTGGGFFLARGGTIEQLLAGPIDPYAKASQIDLDGDGRPELVLVEGGPPCRVFVAAFPPGGGSPAVKVAASFACAKPAASRIFFADANDDRRLDLFVTGADGSDLLYPALADGTFDTGNPVTDPALVHAPEGALQSFAAARPGKAWIGTHDVNGDGLPDVLFDVPAGAWVITADTTFSTATP